jgi:hypothetical protein
MVSRWRNYFIGKVVESGGDHGAGGAVAGFAISAVTEGPLIFSKPLR